MLAVNYSTIRNNLKDYCDKATDQYETVIVTRKDEKNIVILSLEKYNDMMRAAHNAEYLDMIDRSMERRARARWSSKRWRSSRRWPMSSLTFTEKAWEDYLYWQTTDKSVLRKINELLKDIQRSGVSKGIGKPELLKYRKAWSRRINHEHRLVYMQDASGVLVILSLRGHYED